MTDNAGKRKGGHFRGLALLVLSFGFMLLVAGISLSSKGREEMSKSDAAFHSGELRRSIDHAKRAALAYVPGSQHVRQAYERLEAIAKGAEAQGDTGLGRLAWETLASVQVQTDYPGRPESELEREARAALRRLDDAQERKLEGD